MAGRYVGGSGSSVQINIMKNALKKNGILIVLCAQVMIMMLGMGVISPILPQYAQTFGVNITMVGMLITGFGLARIFVDIPAASMTEKFGRRPVLIAGTIIQTLSSLGCALAANYWQLLVFRVVQGVGSAAFTTAAMIALTDISSHKNRGQVMSTYQGSLLLGAGLGPTLGGFIAQYFDLRAPFFALAALSLVGVVWAYLRIPETRPAELQRETVSFSLNPFAHLPISQIKLMLGNINFLAISIISFGVFFMRTGSQNEILPLLAHDRILLDSGQIGVTMTIMSIMNFIVLFACGKLSDRFGRKIIITPGVLLTVVALVMLSQSYSYWFLVVTCIIWGIGTGIAGPIPSAYVADILDRENYSTGMGLFRTVSDLGFVIGPLLLGWMADSRGYSFPLLFNAGFMLLAVILFHSLSREPPRGQKE